MAFKLISIWLFFTVLCWSWAWRLQEPSLQQSIWGKKHEPYFTSDQGECVSVGSSVTCCLISATWLLIFSSDNWWMYYKWLIVISENWKTKTWLHSYCTVEACIVWQVTFLPKTSVGMRSCFRRMYNIHAKPDGLFSIHIYIADI